MQVSEIYRKLGIHPDFTPVDTAMNQVGVGIVVGFAMLDQHDD